MLSAILCRTAAPVLIFYVYISKSNINLNMETYKLVAELVLILNFCFLLAIKLKVTKVGY